MTRTSQLPLDVLVAASHARLTSRIGSWLVHDLRGPLQGVTLTLALLAETAPDGTPLDGGLRNALGSATDECARLVDLTDRLLRLPQLHGDPAPVPFGDVLTTCGEFLAHRRPRAPMAWPESGALAGLPAVAGGIDQLIHATLAMLVCAIDAAGAGPNAALGITVAAATDAVRMEIVARPDPAGAAPDPLLLEASRLLLERTGGGLDVSDGGRSTVLVARLGRWRAPVRLEQAPAERP